MFEHTTRIDVHHRIARTGDERPTVALQIVRGRARHRLRPVRVPVFLIGAADDCDLVLGDPQFADVHAYVRIDDAGVIVRHLGFAPGISLNGRAVTKARLADGDRIRTGPFEFVARIGQQRSDDLLPATELLPRLLACDDRLEDEPEYRVSGLLSEVRGQMQQRAQMQRRAQMRQ